MDRQDLDINDILREFREEERRAGSEPVPPVPEDGAVSYPEPGGESRKPVTAAEEAPAAAWDGPAAERDPEASGEAYGAPDEPPAAQRRVRRKKTGGKGPHDRTVAPESGEPGRRKSRSGSRRTDRRHPFLTVLFSVLLLFCLAFSLVNIHPTLTSSAGRRVQAAAQGTPQPETIPEQIVLAPPSPTPTPAEATPEPTPEVTTEPTPEPTPEPVHYTIPETALVAPAPRAEGYGTVGNDYAYEVLNVIQRARDSGLLRPDERTVFDPNANFYRGAQARDIEYYLDDTILVLLWKEEIDGNSVTFTEVRIADGSQIRRKFADDSFGASSQYFATELARSTNAVVAMNADFYLFRDFGMVAFNRELYRFNTAVYTGPYSKYNCVETLFVNGDGDFLYKRLGEENTWESIQQFIWDNNILFSVAFGPVLVENGQALTCDWYPVGEIDRGYSRAGIGQVDHLHYLYMSLNHSWEREARWTVNTFAQHFAEKGVITAYCLDGGQTGEVVFRGEPYNYIDFGKERLVSDIIYFATALPQEGGAAG